MDHENWSGKRMLVDEEDETGRNASDSHVLRNSVLIYGGALLVVIVLFSWLRRRFPRVYNVRSWAKEVQTELALEDKFRGFFGWIWNVYTVTDDEIMEECGLDAVCFIRLIQMGYRISIIGIFNTIWLLPVYITSDVSIETESVTDRVERTTVANVPSGSPRLYATVFAAYVLFLYTIYLIWDEFKWFIEARHKHKKKLAARNFAVFVRNVPPCYQDNQRLKQFFDSSFGPENVLEAQVPMKIPNLTKSVAQRDATVEKLEHAHAMYRKTGVRPRHKDKLLSAVLGEDVDSIDCFTKQLDEQNEDVTERLAALEMVVKPYDENEDVEDPKTKGSGLQRDGDEGDKTESSKEPDDDSKYEIERPKKSVFSIFQRTTATSNNPTASATSNTVSPLLLESNGSADGYDALSKNSNTQVVENSSSISGSIGKSLNTVTLVATRATHAATHAASKATNAASHVASKATDAATSAAAQAVSIVLGGEDGQAHPAGFVVFTKLSTTNAALQMIHHEIPFAMEVMEAPDPKEICWSNIGREHKDLQIGKLISFGLTAGLCLLWTIPISFFASLSNAAAVRDDVDWLDKLFDSYPGLVPILEQMAPFLVVVFNALLPMILETISLFEGPISTGAIEASTFVKLAAFMIIQTFFVSAISGSVLEAISDIIADWTEVVDLLARSLPAQGTYFMQIVLVSTATSAVMEMLRVVAIVMAALRNYIGPNLTEKEKNKVYFGLRPLSSPKEFEHADFTSQLVLYFMVLFVYTVISPMTPLITGFSFLFLGAMFRWQFIHINPKHPDSGGRLWQNFIQIILTCMIIAQVTIFGLLGLKKAVNQLPLYIPLLIITFLFNIYIREKHFQISDNLPTRECLKQDLARDPAFDLSFLRGAYKQPPLAAKKIVTPEELLVVG